jgi:hypothetical protein
MKKKKKTDTREAVTQESFDRRPRKMIESGASYKWSKAKLEETLVIVSKDQFIEEQLAEARADGHFTED